MIPPAEVPGRLAAVHRRLEAAAARAGRPAGGVRLVAVTKGVDRTLVQAALEAGQHELGESRAQELLEKAPGLSPRPTWHFIGRLQRNKVAALASVVDLWQSVDRLELGAAIARRAPGAAVLAEVNVAADPAKAGCPPEEAPALVDGLREMGLTVEGLMTVPAAGVDPRSAFGRLAELAARLELNEVSMGMTDDFELAVGAGATIVRVGRAIFGDRPDAGSPPGGR